ncbi:MAG TPA: WG repeat-containing protein [Cytophagales bacterium]|nr:WG repeat-containing protein [Cytophagales bacterium]
MQLKSLSIALIFVFIAYQGYSQTYVTQAKPYKEDNWGYLNNKGEFVIAPQYRKCFEFSEDGYAPVLEGKSKQYQFINLKGEKLNTEISEFRLKEMFGMNVQGFNSGMVPVRIGEKWGYMNTAGKEAVKASYDKANEFHDGFASAQKGGVNYIIDKTGKETEVSDPKVLTVKNFSEGLAPFESKDKKEGFVDVNGKVVIEPQFQSVGYFSDGLAWAKTVDEKVGFLNKQGEWVIEPQFTAAKNFDAKSGLARVKVADSWQFVDKTGKVMTLNDAESFDDFKEGLCSGKKGGKIGFYDNTGKWVIEPQFEGVRDFKNGFAAAKSGGKWGMIDRSGKWVIEPNYSGIKDMELVK